MKAGEKTQFLGFLSLSPLAAHSGLSQMNIQHIDLFFGV